MWNCWWTSLMVAILVMARFWVAPENDIVESSASTINNISHASAQVRETNGAVPNIILED